MEEPGNSGHGFVTFELLQAAQEQYALHLGI